MLDLNGKKVLIIQTAFIGDVVLATSIVGKLNLSYPQAEIHFLLRRGNEGLLSEDPRISRLLIWDKKKNKYAALWEILKIIRGEKYDLLINVQRFLSTGLITAFSGAKITTGFRKNPLSYFFSKRYDHVIGDGTHEVERNHQLISEFTDQKVEKPSLNISDSVKKRITGYQEVRYICIAPSSVWYTKQFPEPKWIELIDLLKTDRRIYLIGGPGDAEMCERILVGTKRNDLENLAGKLSFLESALLMKGAEMNYANDSAPLHFASAVNANVTAIFCSTIPEFGFGPLSDQSKISQVGPELSCRPCGLHGKKTCPEGHFKCGFEIDVESLLPKSSY
jgi:heptosyltransferase-2